MPPKNDEGSENLPWFRRFSADGKPEPLAARGHGGEILILDGDGWAASFKNGAWHPGILFVHDKIAAFSPVEERDEIYRLYNEARTALGLGKGPTDNPI